MNTLHQKRIFLTGGTGLFGKWLLEHFQTLEVKVVVLSRNPAQFVAQFPMFGKNPSVTFVRGDVRDFEFPAGQFDYAIHAATEASEKLERENSAEMYSVIVDGTRRVLEFSKQAGVNRLLYVSSGAVYGVQPPELPHVPETFPCNPVTAYGKGKLKAEQLCLESGVETVIARCFAFVGPWLPLDTHFAIGNFIGNCLRNEPIEIQGDGTPLRSYMYGSDLAEWLLTLLLKGRSGEAYNVGSEEVISIADLAQLVRSVAGTDNKVRIYQQPVVGHLPARYIPSIQKVTDELGVTLKLGLAEAINQTVLYYRSDRV
jgi:dTDP-glucose 4,6-dehydratase